MLYQCYFSLIVTRLSRRMVVELCLFYEPQCYNQNELGSISKENVANVMKIS